MRTRIVCAVLAAAASGCLADDWIWTGNVNGTWNTTDYNWKNSGGPVLFSPGADVLFNDSAAQKTVTLSGSQSAGNVVFDNTADYTLAHASGAKLNAATSLVKRGTGELTITGRNHTFTGDVLVEEGTLATTTGADNDDKDATWGPLGNPRAPRTITVLTNATLSMVGKTPFGAGTSDTPVLTDLRVIGGTVLLCTNFPVNLGSLWLENATVNYYGAASGGNDRAWGLNIGSNLTFKGETPYVFAARNGSRFNFGKHRITDIWVDDITGDSAPDVTFQIPVCNVANGAGQAGGFMSRFNKLGPGTLVLGSNSSTFTGEVNVVEGTLRADANYASLTATYSALGNPRVPHRVFVGTNATLELTKNDIQGQAWNNSQIELIISGGTLAQSNALCNCFGPLTLDNATLIYNNRNGDWGTFVFDGDVTFRGTNAYNLAEVNGSRIRCGYNRMTFFNVEDIPGTNIDVNIGMQINDCIAWSNGGAEARPSRFGKRGAGTLRLSNHGNTFTGDIEVEEGILQIPVGGNGENKVTSCIGNPQIATRTVTVHSGSELYFMTTDTLGQLASSVKMGMVISNATLRMANDTANGFGPLKLHNAQIIYNGGYSTTRTWGVMGLGGRTEFSGTNAYTFAVIGNYCRFSLGYSLDSWKEPLPSGWTNWWGKSEFVVHDITGDTAADVTFNAPLQDIPDWPNTAIFKNTYFKCGLLKSGEGTLRLASTDNTYTGPTVVTQGVLRVDGSLTTSAVTAAAGGFLSGTGSVMSVTVEAGGGFDAEVGKADVLKVGTLTAATGSVVRVHAPAGFDRTTLNVPFLKIVGGGTFNPAGWTVLVDGVPPSPGLRTRVASDGTVYAKWAPAGTMVLIK